MFKRAAWLILLLGVSYSSLARATIEEKHWEIGVLPGISLPAGNSNDLETDCLSAAVSAEYQWNRKFSAGLEFAKDIGHKFDGVLFTDIDNDGIGEALKARGNVRSKIYRIGSFLKWGAVTDWGTWSTRWVRNFLILGAGLYHYEVNQGELELGGTSSMGVNWNNSNYTVPHQSSNHFGLNIGVGMQAEIFAHGLVGFEIRYHRFFRTPVDSDYWIPSLKFGYAF